MQKIYQKPEMVVVRIETTKMLAASVGFGAAVDSGFSAESHESFDITEETFDMTEEKFDMGETDGFNF